MKRKILALDEYKNAREAEQRADALCHMCMVIKEVKTLGRFLESRKIDLLAGFMQDRLDYFRFGDDEEMQCQCDRQLNYTKWTPEGSE